MQTVQGKEALPSPAPTPSPAWPCSRHRKDGTEEPTSCNGLLGFALVFLHLQRSETKREQRHTGSPAPTAGWKGRLGEPNAIAVSFPTSVTRGMEAFYSRRWGEKDHSTKNKQKKKNKPPLLETRMKDHATQAQARREQHVATSATIQQNHVHLQQGTSLTPDSTR